MKRFKIDADDFQWIQGYEDDPEASREPIRNPHTYIHYVGQIIDCSWIADGWDS